MPATVMIQIETQLLYKGTDAADTATYVLPAIEAPARSIVCVGIVVDYDQSASPDTGALTGNGLTWTKAGSGNATTFFHRGWLFYAYVSHAQTLNLTFTSGLLAYGMGVVVSASKLSDPLSRLPFSIRQLATQGVVGEDEYTFHFDDALLPANSYGIFIFQGTQVPAAAPSGWTRLTTPIVSLSDPPANVAEQLHARNGGESGTDITFAQRSVGQWWAGFELQVDPPCSLETPDPNYTVGTFDLFLAPIDSLGRVGDDEEVGNVVVGTYDDDAEMVQVFDPDGILEEPIGVGFRDSDRVMFTGDNINCENLQRWLDSPGVNDAGGTTFGVDSIFRSQMYRVTLEHTMPCGHIVTRVIPRACFFGKRSWLFSPDTLHGLPFEMRSMESDRDNYPFGEWSFSPGTCGASS